MYFENLIGRHQKIAESEGACQSFSKTSEIDGNGQANKTGSHSTGSQKTGMDEGPCVRVS